MSNDLDGFHCVGCLYRICPSTILSSGEIHNLICGFCKGASEWTFMHYGHKYNIDYNVWPRDVFMAVCCLCKGENLVSFKPQKKGIPDNFSESRAIPCASQSDFRYGLMCCQECFPHMDDLVKSEHTEAVGSPDDDASKP